MSERNEKYSHLRIHMSAEGKECDSDTDCANGWGKCVNGKCEYPIAF